MLPVEVRYVVTVTKHRGGGRPALAHCPSAASELTAGKSPFCKPSGGRCNVHCTSRNERVYEKRIVGMWKLLTADLTDSIVVYVFFLRLAFSV